MNHVVAQNQSDNASPTRSPTDGSLTVTLESDPEPELAQVRREDEREPDRPSLCYGVEPCDTRFAFLDRLAMHTLRENRSLTESRKTPGQERSGAEALRILEEHQVARHEYEDEMESADDRHWHGYQRWLF
jgi:hypothetical protein